MHVLMDLKIHCLGNYPAVILFLFPPKSAFIYLFIY